MKKMFTAVLLLGLATPGFAQPGPGAGMGMGMGPRHGISEDAEGPHGSMEGHRGIMAQLKLTDDQQSQMQKLRFEMQRKQTTTQSKIRLARLDIQELVAAANPDKAAIEKKMKEVSDLQYQEKLNHLDHLFAVKAILTPEQQKLWKEHMKSAVPEMRERVRERIQERRIER